ncbi:50S ribosomal protein L21e [Candidatus Woesearchaeota archaeon]|nr:50S ribosomal protein L21e [Candidatus Woesearchaeota archaeon]
MVTRIGRFRRKTRKKMTKKPSVRGKFSITKYLQEFKLGDRVVLKLDSAVQKGMYFPRFHGNSGLIKAKKGRCYEVAIKDIKKEKTVIVHPVHLKKLKK